MFNEQVVLDRARDMLTSANEKTLRCVLENMKVRAYKTRNFLDFVWVLHPQTGMPSLKRIRGKDGKLPVVHTISTYWNDGKANATHYWMYEPFNFFPNLGRKVKLDDLDLDKETMKALILDVIETMVLFLYYEKLGGDCMDDDDEYLERVIYPELWRLVSKVFDCTGRV